MSSLNPRPSELPGRLPSGGGPFSLYWLGICGILGMGAPLPKSDGSAVIFCEYRLLTRSAVLSAPRGLSRGAPPLSLDRVDSFDGRDSFGGRLALESAAAPIPGPTGMGELICRGALMAGGPPFLDLSPRFLRREIPFSFCLSDMLPATSVQDSSKRRGSSR